MARRTLIAIVIFVLTLWGLPLATPALAASPDIVVSQVYGAGGNSGATYQSDYVELFNRGSAAVNVTGWSVQYASTAGSSWQRTDLSGWIRPGRYFLVRESTGTSCSGAPCGVPLPQPHVIGTIAMAAGAGKIALVNTNTTIATGTVCPVGAASVVDFVGYGTGTNCFEGTGPTTPSLSGTTAAFRKLGGAQDNDSNAADFANAAPAPRATADYPITVVATAPTGANVPLNTNVGVTFSENATVTGTWFTISCAASGTHTATWSGGPLAFTIDPDTDFEAAETCTVTVLAAQVTDQDTDDPPDQMASNFVFTFDTLTPPVFIHDIQGAAHISPKLGKSVAAVPGVVTAKAANGFWMEDGNPDADVATSEGIFVFTSSAPSSLAVGDAVTVSGKVQEFRPGGGGLTITEIGGSPVVAVQSHANALPPAIVIGSGGRLPPTEVIENDATNVETDGVFDPATDGIDFWESLEGMLVDLGPVVVTGPSAFDELGVLANNGADATGRTARGGIIVTAADKNPEKATIRGLGFTMPKVNTGDHFAGPIVGVVDYDFSNFMVDVLTAPTRIADGVTREVTTAPVAHELTVATFNVENLDPGDGATKFDTLARLIVNNLLSPDVISLEEVQDNNGATDDGTVDATTTLTMLASAIGAAGGPAYEWKLIDPVNDQDGGEPGGNIRQAFFFRTDRGVSFISRPGATSTTANTVVNAGGSPQLQFSPGRIDPTNGAFSTSRKPLAGEFSYNGHHVFVIANHFNSKGGDDPLWGFRQPPVLSSEVQRQQQATIVKSFVQGILAIDANAEVVVLGDLNDFEFSNPVMTLKSAPLNDLIETLPANERYTYVFEGNSQALDHILVSNSLLGTAVTDVVHVNSEFWDQASDHEPQVARLRLLDTTVPTITASQSPAANANGWNNGAVAVTFTCSDNVGIASCLGNTTLTAETSGQTVTGTAADLSGNTASASVTVRIDTTAPTFTWSGSLTYSIDQTVAIGCAITETLSGIDPAVASHCDTASGPAYTFGLGTHVLTAAATDLAGNASTASATFTVSESGTSLCTLATSFVSNAGEANSLCVKLEAAAAAAARGNTKAHDNQIQAFVNEVNAQRGKALTTTNADTLISLAGAL